MNKITKINPIAIGSTGLSLLILLVSMMFATHSASAQEAGTVTYVKIQVDGLSCPFCAYGLEKNLKKVEGSKDVLINVEDGYTTFNVPKDKQPTEDELKKTVKDAGFTARKIVFSDKPFPNDEK